MQCSLLVHVSLLERKTKNNLQTIDEIDCSMYSMCFYCACFFLCLDAILACRREIEKRIIKVLITKRPVLLLCQSRMIITSYILLV